MPLNYEPLETKRLLAVFTVTNLDDGPVAAAGDLPGSLRQALFDANATSQSDDIVFQSGLSGVVALTAGELAITEPLRIIGPEADRITIDASGNDTTPNAEGGGTRVLNIDDGDIQTQFQVELSRLVITGGDVTGSGGGIRSRENLVLIDSIVTGNTVSGTDARGGGIDNYMGNLQVRQSTVSDNHAVGTTGDGGGIHHGTTLFGTQRLRLIDSTVSANTAGRDGGGIFTGNNLLEDQATLISNSTISGNTAGRRGGGIFNFDGQTTIRWSTITANQGAPDAGSGIASYGDAGTHATLHSTIVTGNPGVDLAVVAGNVNSLSSAGYNLIGTANTFGSGSAADDSFTQPGDQTGVLDAALAALADNGGPTQTHALLPASPALDAGDPTAVVGSDGLSSFDQRGTPFDRIEDGNGDSTARIDIGAYERQSATVANADFDGNGRIGGGDFLIWQRNYPAATGATQATGDADSDTDVDAADLEIFEETFGQSTAPAAAAATSSDEQRGSTEESWLVDLAAFAGSHDQATADGAPEDGLPPELGASAPGIETPVVTPPSVPSLGIPPLSPASRRVEVAQSLHASIADAYFATLASEI